MGPAPRLSLCIPTSAGRAQWLKVALTSAIQEALAHPPGTVEVLVSDNGSGEPTASLLRQFQEQHPWLRVVGFPDNRGFDSNYVNCFQKAQGEWVWVMGDDDMFLPGCAARVMAAADAGADAILSAAYECDSAMKPLEVRSWFKEPTPPSVWHLDSEQDLTDYFNGVRFEAGAFLFISAVVIRRDRFLAIIQEAWTAAGTGCIQAYGMMLVLRSPTCLHWMPQPLFANRLDNDSFGTADPYGRMSTDLQGWLWIADRCFPEPNELRRAFLAILRSNHQDRIVRVLRWHAGFDRDKWLAVRGSLVAVGFSPALVNAVDLAFHVFMLEVPPPRGLDPDGLCLADLAMVTRAARRIAVLAEVGLDDFLAATPLLEALRLAAREAPVRVLCPEGLAPLLSGFDLQTFDHDRLLRDNAYLEAQTEALQSFAPDLLVNLDRARSISGDLFAEAALAAGALGFDDETPDNRNDPTRLRRSLLYRRLLPRDAPAQALAQALGLDPGPGRLWTDPASQAKAREVLVEAGWDPRRTLAVLGDDPGALAGPVALRLDQAIHAGWNAVGLGGPGTRPALQHALGGYGEHARNLAETLSLGELAAILQNCGAHLGGSRTFQALAGAAGCAPFEPAGTSY